MTHVCLDDLLPLSDLDPESSSSSSEKTSPRVTERFLEVFAAVEEAAYAGYGEQCKPARLLRFREQLTRRFRLFQFSHTLMSFGFYSYRTS